MFPRSFRQLCKKPWIRYNSKYEQIPEHLKIHMFAPELRIIRDDELKGSFKKFSPEFIVGLLDMRANEIRLEKENSNPDSRLTLANITRIMKLTSRLKQLFEVNGGNTEILDAVISSQSLLDKLEEKLARKRQAIPHPAPPIPKVSHKEYLQIPEDIEIHKFVDLLKDIQLHEVKASFGSLTAPALLEAVDRRIKNIDQTEALVSYRILRSRLKRLFDINGSYTFILDTVINSQSVFDKFEQKIKSREAKEYKQVPDYFILEDFCEELEMVRSQLGSNFSENTSQDILHVTSTLALKESSESKAALQKLLRNLESLFRHNNNTTFVLDNVISNSAIFREFESKLEDKTCAELVDVEPVKYRDGVLPLLESHNSFFDEEFLEQDLKIKTAVLEAMSKEEKKLSASDPEEYESLKNLTPESIRESYRKNEPLASPLEKAKVESFLKQTKRQKESLDEMKWREQEAYEWSSIAFQHRSLEAKNFFNSLSTEYSFPMFPGSEQNLEFLIVSTNGKQLTAVQNPLGLSHVPENVVTILEKVPQSELQVALDSIARLKKKNWKLIGSGKNGTMLVFSRGKKTPSVLLTLLKSTIFATVVVVVLSIMDAQRSKPKSQETATVKEAQNEPVQVQKPIWRRFFWAS